MAEGKKVIAITEIHRTLEPGKPGDKAKGIRPTPPKVQIIAPKTVFMTLDKDEYDSLLEAGAIREPEKDEKVAVDIKNIVPEDTAKKAAAKTAAKSKDTGGSTTTKPTGSKGETTTTGTTKHGSTASGAEGAGDDLV